MAPRRILILLLAAALFLPIVICILSGAAGLLAAMADPTGASVLRAVAFALGLIWIIDLVGLLLFQGLRSLDSRDGPRSRPDEQED